MEPIKDLAWRAQMALGTLERFELNGWSVIAVGLDRGMPNQGGGLFRQTGTSNPRSSLFSSNRYRLLFFPRGGKEPLYTVNMESSILGDWVIAEQEGTGHRVVERLSAPLSYSDFRIKALERALTRIGTGEMEKSEKKGEKMLKNLPADADNKHG